MFNISKFLKGFWQTSDTFNKKSDTSKREKVCLYNLDDCGEPVLTLMALFKTKPKRFTITTKEIGDSEYGGVKYFLYSNIITDKVTGICAKVTSRRFTKKEGNPYTGEVITEVTNIDMEYIRLTSTESYFLTQVFMPYFLERRSKYRKISNKRQLMLNERRWRDRDTKEAIARKDMLKRLQEIS